MMSPEPHFVVPIIRGGKSRRVGSLLGGWGKAAGHQWLHTDQIVQRGTLRIVEAVGIPPGVQSGGALSGRKQAQRHERAIYRSLLVLRKRSILL